MLNIVKRYGLLGFVGLALDVLYSKLFFPHARIVRLPFRVRGRQNIQFGKNLTTGTDCRLEAFPSKEGFSLNLGDNIQINDSVHIAAINSVKIGNRVLIASKVFISDHNHGSYGYNDIHSSPIVPPIERELSSAPVNIADDVWIGEFVAILPGVTIGKGTIIGTMSVVTKDIPEYSIAVGSPAKVIKQYDFKKEEWVRV